MFSKLSLSKKLLFVCCSIGLMTPILGGLIYFKAAEIAELNAQVSNLKLPKTKQLGEIVYRFRNIRLEIRTVPVLGMSAEKIEQQLKLTQKSVEDFVKVKNDYKAQIENDTEKALFNEFDKHAVEFLNFGGILIELAKTGNSQKMAELAQLVRDVCPVKAAKVETAINMLIDQQSAEAVSLVKLAHKAEAEDVWVIAIGSILVFVFSLGLGTWAASSISNVLQTLADELGENVEHVASAADQVLSNGTALSVSATQQATALKQTVTTMDEISSMIGKNSDNAAASKKSAESSLKIAESGKNIVDELVSDIQDIQTSTLDLIESVNTNNHEVSKVVAIINEIELKTTVINDIVFQTKLLSFNAAVEAARAGESGKGFAVVADEVGKLAAMSGQSAKEITELLGSSVEMVQNIVSTMQSKLEKQSASSKLRVSEGIKKGQLCGKSLSDILAGNHTVDAMVSEITIASQEQAKGVSEVAKAMGQIDSMTNKNASVSRSSAVSAEKLNQQAKQMKMIVSRLYNAIHGETKSAQQKLNVAKKNEYNKHDNQANDYQNAA